MKFTLLVFGAAAIALLTLDLLLRRRARIAWAPAASFVGFFVAWWAVLGQHFTNIPAFLRMFWEVAAGYSEAEGTRYIKRIGEKVAEGRTAG